MNFVAPRHAALTLLITGMTSAIIISAEDQVRHTAIGGGSRGGVFAPGLVLIVHPVITQFIENGAEATRYGIVEIGGRSGFDAKMRPAEVIDGFDAAGGGNFVVFYINRHLFICTFGRLSNHGSTQKRTKEEENDKKCTQQFHRQTCDATTPKRPSCLLLNKIEMD